MLFFILTSIILFLVGLCGITFYHKNVILIFMSIELMLLSVNLNFIVFSIYLDDILGQIFSLLILSIAAAEVALGLALVVVYFRISSVSVINLMRFFRC